MEKKELEEKVEAYEIGPKFAFLHEPRLKVREIRRLNANWKLFSNP